MPLSTATSPMDLRLGTFVLSAVMALAVHGIGSPASQNPGGGEIPQFKRKTIPPGGSNPPVQAPPPPL